MSGVKDAFNTHATAFATVDNVYCPYYRQSDLPKTIVSENDMWKIADSIPFDDKVPAYADARIDLAKGALICSSVDANALELYIHSTNYSIGVYHLWDYPFYYYNLRENAERRAKKFLGK